MPALPVTPIVLGAFFPTDEIMMHNWLDEATRRRLIIATAVMGGVLLGMWILRRTHWFL